MDKQMLLARVVGLGAGLAGMSAAACAQELYMMYSDNKTLLLMDAPTGVVIDSLPIEGALSLGRGLAMRWDGMLFTTADDRLFRINPKTGEGTTVGDNLPVTLMSLGADPFTGVLYGISDSTLYRIDHKTGELTEIGIIDPSEGHWPFLSFAVGRDGMGYVTDMYNINCFRVNLQTAAAEFACSFGSQWWYGAMTFDGDGRMWAVRDYDGLLRVHDVGTCERESVSDGWYIDGLAANLSHGDCYADCDGNEDLDFFDFLCFINEFNVGNPYSDCNGDAKPDLFDFLCFVNSFNAGC